MFYDMFVHYSGLRRVQGTQKWIIHDMFHGMWGVIGVGTLDTLAFNEAPH